MALSRGKMKGKKKNSCTKSIRKDGFLLYIGKVCIEQTAALAPMASTADCAYRTVCKQFGASYLVGEMVSAKGLCYSSKNSARLLNITPQERPMAIQLFGSEPEFMARAAEIALAYSPDAIDINMGCPVPKVVKGGSGSALMKTPLLAENIVRETVRAAGQIPVTVKIRTGWDDQSVNAVEFARRMEQSGAKAITVHGRTRKQMYSGKADWNAIRQVKQAVRIPVIGNGDVDSPQAAKAMYDQTGVDLVMVGRASMGRPWLFSQIKSYLASGSYSPDPPLERRMDVMLEHVRRMCEQDGERIAMKKARAQTMHYFYGLKNAAKLRARCSELSCYADLFELVRSIHMQEQGWE